MATSDKFKLFTPDTYPQLGDVQTFLTRQLGRIRDSLTTAQEVFRALDTTKTPLLNAVDDPTAASLGVPLNGLYHTNGTVKVRRA